MLLQAGQVLGERMGYIMGLPKDTLAFIVNNAGKLKGKRMLELGNQQIRETVEIPFKTGKDYFADLGCDHTSIDMNEKDGALPFDLSVPIHGLGKFDIITNSGTSGYVDDQIECFRNINSFCKTGGLMIHIVAEKGSKWSGIQYDENFFIKLADQYNYQIIKSELLKEQHGELRAVVLRKNKKGENDKALVDN